MRTITDKVGEGVKQMLTTAGKEGGEVVTYNLDYRLLMEINFV